MYSEKDHMAGVIANTLLSSEAAQDKLIEFVWERMTDEQKQALTDAAYTAAMDRATRIVESRIYAIGTGAGARRGVNFFARHVEAAVRKAFESEKLGDAITAMVQEHLAEVRAGLGETVVKGVNNLTTALFKSIVERVDVYALQSALRDALKASIPTEEK